MKFVLLLLVAVSILSQGLSMQLDVSAGGALRPSDHEGKTIEEIVEDLRAMRHSDMKGDALIDTIDIRPRPGFACKIGVKKDPDYMKLIRVMKGALEMHGTESPEFGPDDMYKEPMVMGRLHPRKRRSVPARWLGLCRPEYEYAEELRKQDEEFMQALQQDSEL